MTGPSAQHPAHARTAIGRERFGVLGASIVLLGAIVLIVAFTVVDWYRHDAGDTPSHFGDIRAALDKLDAYHAANGVASAYFGWLAWLLFALAVVVALLANVPGGGVRAMRWLAVMLAFVGIILTALAIKVTSGSDVTGSLDYSDYLHQARLGFYFALAGFVLTGIGALVGPRRTG